MCLDVINQTWSPLFGTCIALVDSGQYSYTPVIVFSCANSLCLLIVSELLNVFDVFIPQLLRYPNPSDPLNGEAASLLMKDAELYNNKVRGACAFISMRSYCFACLYCFDVLLTYL